ncbi:hypothetical protein [Catenulispora pinisilvae]|uniref:hypothetical protein n=1 Tax=Catenulispora pinisilvae TaxID=2705253 RepID=UPI001891AABD|nr:hypothetical protein [Catenulispora pinisilvae]
MTGAEPVEAFRSERHFRLKSVEGLTHRSMRFTSEQDGGLATRVEIYFGSVGLMLVYPEMEGLVIRPACGNELREVIAKHGLPDDTIDVYLLESGGRQGFVQSGQPHWREAAVAYYEPSLFFSGGPWSTEDLVASGMVAEAD